jgi:peptidoglycan hydrolase-like protein with peptidoglycan-binding domain
MSGRAATPGEITAIQRALAARRFYGGEIDGIAGKQTRDAVKLYQAARGREVTGILTRDDLMALEPLVELGVGRVGLRSVQSPRRGSAPTAGVDLRSVLRVLRPRSPTAHGPKRRGNPITDFFTNLLVRKGAELLSSNLKGHPIMTMLSGYKTYILAILILASALSENLLGIDVPGFSMGLGEAFAVGLALITGRAGAKADAAKVAGQ